MDFCLRCHYKLKESVKNYSLFKYGFFLCRNCQDWLIIKDELTTDEKISLLRQVILNPNTIIPLPDYEVLIKNRQADIEVKQPIIKDNKIIYSLRIDNGIIERFESDLLLKYHCTFTYGGKTYIVINTVDNCVFCRQVPANIYGHSRENDISTLSFEDTIIDFFAYRGIQILPKTLTETKFKELVLEILSKYFSIKEEVWGTHFSGRKMKIDAILTPLDNSEWRNKDLVIGLEIKNPLTWETNNRRDTDILAQAMDYSFSKFDGIKDMIVVLCPLLPGLKRSDKLLRFVAGYNVGHLELNNFNNSNYISMGIGGQAFWQENGYCSPLKIRMFNSKYGNRGYKYKATH